MKKSVALIPLCVLLIVSFASTADAQTTCTSVSLSRTSFYAGYKSAYWSVKVTTPTPDCAWEVTISRGTQDSSAWLLLNDKPDALSVSGVGAGTFALRTLVNTTGAWRFGAVTVAGTTYKVTQERQPDTVPPTVSFVSPPANATVAATIEISAIAGDDVGVKGVQFKVDGQNVGAEDLAAPYAASWNTTLVSDGPHTLTAVARDAVGNTSVATATVQVKNIVDPPPPEDPPTAVTNIAPVDGATELSTSPTLSWTPTNATSYAVRLGTTNPPTAVVVDHTATTFVASGLEPRTTYFWQVIARNTGGETASAVWSFTTGAPIDPVTDEPPSAPVVTAPADASVVGLNQALAWAAAGATSYEVKIGTANPPAEVTIATANPTYAPTLAYGTTYYWQVVATNANGSTAGPVWSFSTEAAPSPPANNTILKRLRVVTWNVQFGYSVAGKHDYPNQLDLLASLNPDVVVLQEVTLADFEMPATYELGLESRTGKNWSAMFVQSIAGAPRADSQGNMILTWLPVDQALSKIACAEPNDTRPPAESSCTAFVSYAVTVNSVPLTITGVHLNVRSANYRSYQMGELLPWLDTFGPHRIVAGDFNMEPLDPLWANWALNYADVWAGAVGGTGDLGYTKDQRTLTNLPGRIDYTFIARASTRIAAQSFAVVKTTLSDHHLVVGDYIIK